MGQIDPWVGSSKMKPWTTLAHWRVTGKIRAHAVDQCYPVRGQILSHSFVYTIASSCYSLKNKDVTGVNLCYNHAGFICQRLDIPHSTLSTNEVVYTTQVYVNCSHGFAINDTTSAITIECRDEGKWSSQPICWRMLQTVLLNFYFIKTQLLAF